MDTAFLFCIHSTVPPHLLYNQNYITLLLSLSVPLLTDYSLPLSPSPTTSPFPIPSLVLCFFYISLLFQFPTRYISFVFQSQRSIQILPFSALHTVPSYITRPLVPCLQSVSLSPYQSTPDFLAISLTSSHSPISLQFPWISFASRLLPIPSPTLLHSPP
jgi:hypothetical protein